MVSVMSMVSLEPFDCDDDDGVIHLTRGFARYCAGHSRAASVSSKSHVY